jgi:hypothetical protein
VPSLGCRLDIPVPIQHLQETILFIPARCLDESEDTKTNVLTGLHLADVNHPTFSGKGFRIDKHLDDPRKDQGV